MSATTIEPSSMEATPRGIWRPYTPNTGVRPACASAPRADSLARGNNNCATPHAPRRSSRIKTIIHQIRLRSASRFIADRSASSMPVSTGSGSVSSIDDSVVISRLP